MCRFHSWICFLDFFRCRGILANRNCSKTAQAAVPNASFVFLRSSFRDSTKFWFVLLNSNFCNACHGVALDWGLWFFVWKTTIKLPSNSHVGQAKLLEQLPWITTHERMKLFCFVAFSQLIVYRETYLVEFFKHFNFVRFFVKSRPRVRKWLWQLWGYGDVVFKIFRVGVTRHLLKAKGVRSASIVEGVLSPQYSDWFEERTFSLTWWRPSTAIYIFILKSSHQLENFIWPSIERLRGPVDWNIYFRMRIILGMIPIRFVVFTFETLGCSRKGSRLYRIQSNFDRRPRVGFYVVLVRRTISLSLYFPNFWQPSCRVIDDCSGGCVSPSAVLRVYLLALSCNCCQIWLLPQCLHLKA